MSRHEQRSGLYLAAVPLLLLAVGLAANRFLKVSMHLMFAGFAAVVIVREDPSTALVVVVTLIALAWSRRFLHRHTWPEIAAGFVTGALAGAFAVWPA